MCIRDRNKYAPEEVTPAKAAANGPAPVPGNILAAISAAAVSYTHLSLETLRMLVLHGSPAYFCQSDDAWVYHIFGMFVSGQIRCV